MFFKQSQGDRTIGWSETVVVDAADVAAAYALVVAPGGYATKRTNCLGAGVVNNYSRLVKLDAGPPPIIPKRRQIQPLGGLRPIVTNGVPNYSNLATFGPADFGQLALMMRLSTSPTNTPQYTRTFWICGLADSATTITESGLLAGPAANSITSLMGEITNGRYLIRVQDQSGANVPYLCTSIDYTNNTYTVPGNTFTEGQRIRASGFRTHGGGLVPRGQYQVHINPNGTLSLWNARVPTIVSKLGSFQRVSYTFAPIVSFVARSFTNKKKGRFFGQLAGRRKNPQISAA
jgi:hypothetical protein